MSKLFDSIKKDKFIIAGPCVIESEELCLAIARRRVRDRVRVNSGAEPL